MSPVRNFEFAAPSLARVASVRIPHRMPKEKLYKRAQSAIENKNDASSYCLRVDTIFMARGF